MEKNKIGHVYILTSSKTNLIKIGGTDYPPSKRLNEINHTEPYKNLGPWNIVDFRQVKDWRKVENHLHYIFRSKLAKEILGQKELFLVSANKVCIQLNLIDPTELLYKPKIDRMFQDENFLNYLVELFSFTGLTNWLNIQGAWTFVLFPKTNGGRYFTFNIGRHEVAYSTMEKNDSNPIHMILMDKLILDFKEVKNWIKFHKGNINKNLYNTALPRSTSLSFQSDFTNILEFLKLDGVRRALIAYWSESLIMLSENNTLSPYSRYHNWNAVAEINKRILEKKYFFSI